MAEGHPKTILDLATGSGDLATALQRACPAALVVGADFCLPMLDEARAKGVSPLVQADGLALPFADGSFDAVTIAFGLRNMASWEAALCECSRVLNSSGRLAILDFSLPANPLVRAAYRFYLHRVLPVLAGWATGCPDAYEYLAGSIEKFPRGGGMNALMESCGFCCEPNRAMWFGIVSLYIGTKV